MAGGLAALLDDVALIAKAAAANMDDVAAAAGRTSAKAAGVVIDDAAVTPQFVHGVTPARELPIIYQITKGSLRNKLLIILPIALLLNAIAPWALTPILMLGGCFLSFEGAEKVLHRLFPHTEHAAPAVEEGAQSEKELVRGAIRTDLILSAEIMVISLNEVADKPLAMEAAVLVVVALAITLGVYGAVGLLVKIDDIGLALSGKDSPSVAAVGRGMVKAMPRILSTISYIGTFAMLWVGGHIVVTGLEKMNWWQWPHHAIEYLAHQVPEGAGSWLVETGCSLVVGLLIGTIIAVVVQAVSHRRGR